VGITRVNGDPVCVLAMSPMGRQNPTLVSLGHHNPSRLYILALEKGFVGPTEWIMFDP